jgi:transposase
MAGTKYKVVGLVEEGYSISQAASRYGVNPRTAQRWVRLFRETGDVKRRQGSGRPRISTDIQDGQLVAEAVERPLSTSRTLKAAAQFPGSRKTAIRRLREANLFARRAAHKQILSEGHIRRRLQFAEENLNIDWKDTFFSDECSVSNVNDGPVVVYRPRGKRFDRQYLAQRRSSGRVSVAVWGWISIEGLGMLQRIDGNLTGKQYAHILKNAMLPFARDLRPGKVIPLQHDRSPIHRSEPVQRLLREQNVVRVLDWPANAADLNIIENVWAEVKRVLRDNWPHPAPTTKDALWNLTLDAWEILAEREGFCQKLFDSMEDRVRNVIEADRYCSRY